MLLNEVNFPVFPIRGNRKIYKDPHTGIDRVETVLKDWQLDNKSLIGITLSERRLKIPLKERYPLTFALFNFSQLLNYKKGCMFIDNLGNIFKYKKTRYEKLEYHKVIGYTDIGNSIFDSISVNFSII